MYVIRGEKRLLIAACLVACLMGSFPAYVAYLDQEEAQFHGGVLEEDATKAMFDRIWASIVAFAKWGGGSVLILGIAPIAARRVLGSRSR